MSNITQQKSRGEICTDAPEINKLDPREYIQNNQHLTDAQLGKELNMSAEAVRSRRRRMKLPPKTHDLTKKSPEELVERDLSISRLKNGKDTTDKKYKHLLEKYELASAERDAVKEIKEISTWDIKPVHEKSEATAVVLASDWHIEENVNPNSVNGLNGYTLGIAKERGVQFFQNTKRLVEMFNKDIRIDNLVLAFLGDFISNSIHDELAEGNELPPIEAILEAQNMLASGIEFLLENTKLKLIIPCHSGNHARTTKEQRHATENGNSLEYFMYHNLAKYFQNEKRVQFLISPGYHSYVDIYGYTVRFHHGHNLKFGGGIGGLFIPTFKAISQWNKARRVDLDCFGHFHQFRDGGNFICNGSMIGYNSYALAIKAEYEKPKQAFFLVDKTRGKTITCPILFT